jgi:O-antigen ligase
MKVLSVSFAVSAIGSLVFIAVFPEFGIMQVGDLAGTWRGVFSHKNVLGNVMAVAVFTELFTLVACKGRPRWRLASLSAYFALVVFSNSATALLLSSAYLAGTGFYLLWRRDRLLHVVIVMMTALFVSVVLTIFWSDPDAVLGILGRDKTLTR